MILFDVAPSGGGIAVGIAGFLFLACALVAFIAFKMLRKTVKTAVRLMIVAVILIVALIGGIALILLTSGESVRPANVPTKTRR